jgi:hypothetical protein
MPRIHTITTDTVLSDNDMLLGTDGANGANNATKNFSFGVFKNYITSNVTFTGNTIITGGNLTLDNNKFLESKLTNGTAIDLIGINASNVVKIAQDNQAVTFGQGTVTLGGALSVGNNPVTLGGTLAVTGNTTMTGTLTAGGFTTAGTMSVGGNTNFNAHVTLGNASADVITVSGTSTFNAPITVGSNGTGHAVTIHSAATGRALTYDPTNDSDGMSKLMFGENMKAQFGTNTSDLAIYNNDTDSFVDAGTTAGHLYIRNRGDQKDIIFQAEDGEGGNSPSYETYFMLDGELSEAGTAGVNYTRWPDKANVAFGDVIGGELHGAEMTVFNISHMVSPAQTEKNINITNYSNDGDINLATDNGSGGSTVYIKLDGGEKKILLNETIVFDSVNVEGIQTSGESFADNDTSLMTSAAIDDRINTAVATTDSLSEILAIGNTTGATKISVDNTSSGIDLIDSAKIRLGTGNDLEIYHDGSNSYVSDTGDGNLFLKGGNQVRIVGDSANSDEIWAVFGADAAELWYNGNKKLETTNFGIQTTGSLNIHGAYQFPISDGSAGQVLKTDGSGTLSFANDATGLLGIQQGGNFTNSLIIGHDGTGSLDNALGNTGVGVGAMNAITSGDHNVALGHDALGALTEGLSNVAIGKQALFTVTDQDNNVAIGKDALYNNTANNNTAVGMNAGVNITSGQDNVLMGYLAGQAMTSGYENVVVGKDAAKSMSGSNSTTFKNVVIGTAAYDSRTSGTNNVVIGHGAVGSAGTGGIGNNVVVGGSAGTKMTVGSNSNTVIGYGADISANGSDNEIVIGKDADGLGANKAVIGDSNLTNIAPGADGTVSLGDDTRGFEELILTSPNGSKYRVKVDNSGNLSATAV